MHHTPGRIDARNVIKTRNYQGKDKRELEAVCLVACLRTSTTIFVRKDINSIENSSDSSWDSQPVSSSWCPAPIIGLCRSGNEQTNGKLILFKIVFTCLRKPKSPLVSRTSLNCRTTFGCTHTHFESDDQSTHLYCYHHSEFGMYSLIRLGLNYNLIGRVLLRFRIPGYH